MSRGHLSLPKPQNAVGMGTVKPQQVSILEGSTFIVSDPCGDVRGGPDEPAGLFFRDMRHLSRWELRLNGRELDALAGDAIEYDEAVFFLIEPTGTIYRNPSLSVVRRRHIGEGMQEKIELTNHGVEPIALELSVLFGADFADIFEIKDHLAKTGQHHVQLERDGVTLIYERDGFRRETHICAPEAFFTEESLTFRLTLHPRETWKTEIELSVALTKALRCRCGHRQWLSQENLKPPWE